MHALFHIVFTCLYCLVIDCELFACGRLPGLQRVRLRRLFDQQPRQVSQIQYPIVLYAFVVVFYAYCFSITTLCLPWDIVKVERLREINVSFNENGCF